MKEKIQGFLNFRERTPYKLVKLSGKVPQNFVNRHMRAACLAAEKYTDHFVSYRLRPKRTGGVPVLNVCEGLSSVAIVLQGPLLLENDFTVETVRFYRRCYPGATVIVSTWVGADAGAVSRLEEAGAVVVLSELPDHCGHLNINYQVVNTLAGVKKAVALGAEYVCKTRTDQRFCHTDAIAHLLNLLRTFPICNDDFARPQKGRIVSGCMPYGDLFYPYAISDFFYFGYAEDIEQLFSMPLDDRPKGAGGRGMSRRSISEEMIAPEVQLIRSYISSMGGDNACTVEAHWRFMKNHMIMLSKDELGLYWPKYDERYTENTINGTYYPEEVEDSYHCYNFDFIRWLALYSGTMTYKPEYERLSEYVLQ